MPAASVPILQALAAPEPNFKILASHVRHGAEPKRHYVLQDGRKLKSLIEKWRFEPTAEPLSRCGSDYLIVITNGAASIPISVCFVCSTLSYNHQDRYRATKKRILALLAEDFQPLT